MEIIIESNLISYKDLPQLIVGLDSLNDDANYIHIEDVRENQSYYCPCCKGLIKPRAYKKTIDYQVQPHFYHETGGCREETYVHYICKNWLFEKGCKFIVDNCEYEVEKIEIEKSLHTSFGNYRPDIIVITTIGKIFYFEIKTTNRKTNLYAPKWDELGNDVVEVDTRYFINQKYKNDIPKFPLIYADGECFIKSYSRSDYEDTIAKRKLEWKRQDKLNYKIQWERLDWFWQSLTNYKEKKEDIIDVVSYFEKLDFTDKDFVISVIKKMNCQDLFQKLIPVINNAFYKQIESYDISPYENVKLIQESPRIFYIAFQICKIGNIFWYNSCFINKKVEYYGMNILQKFTAFINRKDFRTFTTEHCPCIDEARKYKYKNMATHKNVHMYLNERCSVYWNFDSHREYCKFDSFDDIMKHQKIIEVIIRTMYPSRSLTKSEHANHMKKHFLEYENILKTQTLIKRINGCKNKYWSATISDNYEVMFITLQIGNICEYSSFNLTYIHSKQELFKNVKECMRHLIYRGKSSHFIERIMEVK